MRASITFVYSWLFTLCGGFCLWGISDYLLQESLLALLFLPFAFRSGILLHSPQKYWLAIFLAESFLLWAVISQTGINIWLCYLTSAVNFLLVFAFYRRYQSLSSQWQKLLWQGILSLSLSAINTLLFMQEQPIGYLFLVSLTGLVLILPECYLVQEYIFKRHWIPITTNLVHQPLELHIRPILFYLCLFGLNILIQQALPNEFYRFSLFSLSLLVILLAFHYGWKGALFGTLLNSVTLIATNHDFSIMGINNLMLTLMIQAITGIFLGLGIQFLRDLNSHLSVELERNQQLIRQLVHTEENIRKDISRELHDEIGQNITAIRMQAGILKRVEPTPTNQQISSMIEQLSFNIYDTTKRLLNRIRPKVLDDLSLKQAIEQLFIEFELVKHGIQVEFHWRNQADVDLEHLMEITVYRLCQESLNNIVKYAQASKIQLGILIADKLYLTIQDNGVGFDVDSANKGLGLLGMKERVYMLGGEFQLSSQVDNHQGTQIQITLPY